MAASNQPSFVSVLPRAVSSSDIGCYWLALTAAYYVAYVNVGHVARRTTFQNLYDVNFTVQNRHLA